MDKYHLDKLLGQGVYSKVYHGRNLKTGESVAIKVMKKEEILAETVRIRHVQTEISAMRTLRHPNIVQLYEVILNENKICIVMEYVKGADLVTKISEEKTKPDEDTKRKYFQQLISAVEFCHSKGVYHRDLKLEHVLVDENGNVKVIDFGLSAMKENAGEYRLFLNARSAWNSQIHCTRGSKLARPTDGAKAESQEIPKTLKNYFGR
jgi:5'-AMP-activated protein kinase catalytic alpha subunit